KRFARPHRSLDRALHFPEFHASFRRSADARGTRRFHRSRHREHRPKLRSDIARLGGKLPPRLAPLCRSLRRTFPANVAILSAQLRRRISGAQFARFFDSLFQRRRRHWESYPRSETGRVLIAHGSSRAWWLRGTRYKRKLLDASRPPILRQFFWCELVRRD